MPNPLELPRVRCAIVPLMRGKRFTGFRRRVVNELVALTLGHAIRSSSRVARRCSGLMPCLTTVIRALNNLPEPAARLRCIQPIWIDERSLDVIDLPARKMRLAHFPLLALAI